MTTEEYYERDPTISSLTVSDDEIFWNRKRFMDEEECDEMVSDGGHVVLCRRNQHIAVKLKIQVPKNLKPKIEKFCLMQYFFEEIFQFDVSDSSNLRILS